jgi:hypothetical protein
MKFLMLSVLLTAGLAGAPASQKFNGIITDSMCDDADHSHMRMGPTDVECAIACITMHDATYVLSDGKVVYTLSDQQSPKKFAGKKVTLTGTLDAKTKTIQVESISAAK